MLADAVERVRYVGEPVAVVVRRTAISPRMRWTDRGRLQPLPLTLAPADASNRQRRAAQGLGNIRERPRRSATANPDPRSRRRPHRVSSAVNYRAISPARPIETYGLIADYEPAGMPPISSSDIPGPVQHPHAVLARALKVPGNRLRLRMPPDAGGSFGVKQGIFPYIALMGIAARVAGPPGEMDRGPARASDWRRCRRPTG
jgi:2-furoyl-CoA dehydrogenase large subunit